MRLAIISDIHGNMEALNQVLADIDAHQIDQIVNLGDNIGYGPDSEAVIESILQRDILSLMGNHELAVLEPDLLDSFNIAARESLVKIRGTLSDRSFTFINSLKRKIVINGHTFVHGFPPDSVITYLFEIDNLQLNLAFKADMKQFCFVGHTHRLEMVINDDANFVRRHLQRGLLKTDNKKQYIFNIGSVGQPRDMDNRAKYAIFDDTTGMLEVRFIQYDIAVTAKKIVDAGLPRIHADRLF